MHIQDPLFDFYRAGLKATGNIIRASLESAEQLRKQQLAAIGEARTAHAQAVAEIDAARNPEELAAVTIKLAGVQTQAAISYWNGIHHEAGESHDEVAKRAQVYAEQIRGNLRTTLGDAPDGSVPIVAALQPLMEVASLATALTARTTEEAAKLTAAQLAAANAGIRQAPGRAQRKSA
jgi:hypothetical protein